MKWVEINTQNEAYDLLENKLWRFHDGCFRELHLWNSYYISEHQMHSGDETMNAKMLFQGNWADGVSAVELYFCEVQHINIVAARRGYWNDIYEATLKKADGIFYWADIEGWDIRDPQSDDVMWIASKGLKWRERSDWMGNTLRYGADDEE